MSDKAQGRVGTGRLLSAGVVWSIIAALLGFYLALNGGYVFLSSSFPLDAPKKPVGNFVDVTDIPNKITYRGVKDGDLERFRNIFYAEDTSGENRFAPPVPFRPARGSVIDATADGAWCPQGMGRPIFPFVSQITNTSENCLSVRITRPAGSTPESKLPVLVWIHGGGHALGSGTDVFYTPDGLVRHSVDSSQPLIFVSIQYRLGLFGFATTKALMAQQHVNAGLKDQRLALEWVEKNIAIFGGDPGSITAAGQSVGACDIGLHLTSYGGQKGVPFQRAIMLSGATALNFNTQTDVVAKNTATVVRSVGCADEGEVDSAAVIECLRNQPFEKLANISVDIMRAARPPLGESFFHPVFDGNYIPDRPSELLRGGKFVKGVPIIASWVANDGAWYAPPTTSTDDEVVSSFTLWAQGLTEGSLARLLELYPPGDFEHMVPPGGMPSAQYFRAAQMSRDLWFACPVVDFTWQYARQGGVQSTRIFEVNQTRLSPTWELLKVPFWRVAHLSDLPYLLNAQDLGEYVDNGEEQLQLARYLSGQIISFVTMDRESLTLNSGSPGLDTWPPAFSGLSTNDLGIEAPPAIALKIFGGINGNKVANVRKHEAPEKDADKALAWDKLLERCEFINSVQARKEIST